MAGEWFGDIEKLQGRAAQETSLTDGEDDISSGAEAAAGGDVSTVTMFIGVSEATAVTLTVDLSPDGGSTWYEAPESPVEITSDQEADIVHLRYNFSRIRVTANNATPVRAQLREVV